MAEAFPKYAKKLPKKEMPNFMVKLISYFDSSAKDLCCLILDFNAD